MPATKTASMSGYALTDAVRRSLTSRFAIPRSLGTAWKSPLAAVLMLMAAIGASVFFAGCAHGMTSVAPAPAPASLGKIAYVQDEDIWVKDLSDGTPQRITNHTEQPNARYFPVMQLSADEQFLYYVKIRWSCPAGGDATSTSGGGEACDLPSIGVIDLNSDREIGAAALPVGCSFPQLTRVGASDALATCQTSSVILTRVSAAGTAQEVARFPMRNNPVIADLDRDGNYYVLYRDGVLRSPDDAGTRLFRQPGDDIGFNTPSLTDTNLWVAAYGFGDGAYAGLLVISREDPSDVQTVPLSPPIDFVTAWRSNSVVLLRTGSSRAAIFDLTTHVATRDDVEVPGGGMYSPADEPRNPQTWRDRAPVRRR